MKRDIKSWDLVPDTSHLFHFIGILMPLFSAKLFASS
jgi:hypothetical protein